MRTPEQIALDTAIDYIVEKKIEGKGPRDIELPHDYVVRALEAQMAEIDEDLLCACERCRRANEEIE